SMAVFCLLWGGNRLDYLMADLNCSDVVAALEQVRGERVPEGVDTSRVLDRRRVGRAAGDRSGFAIATAKTPTGSTTSRGLHDLAISEVASGREEADTRTLASVCRSWR
ncbi:MAG: hypothetical protein ACREMY_29935, partial [bacterium]